MVLNKTGNLGKYYNIPYTPDLLLLIIMYIQNLKQLFSDYTI